MPDNMLRFIKSVIYNLKRDYGGPLDLYQNIVGQADRATGDHSLTKNKWHVHRALRLPRDIHRNAIFSQTGNRIFQYGNFIQVSDCSVVIDARDLPAKLQIGQENWYVIIEHQRFEIVKAEKYDFDAAWFLVLKHLQGVPPEQIVEITVKHDIAPSQTVENQ